MAPGLIVRVVDFDDDYLALDISAHSGRFAGTARIHADPDELSTFARQIEGFPASPKDEQRFDFGSTDPQFAGGFVSVRLYCLDAAGHAYLEATIEDDDQHHDEASARLGFLILAAGVDQFVADLRGLPGGGAGEAILPRAS